MVILVILQRFIPWDEDEDEYDEYDEYDDDDEDDDDDDDDDDDGSPVSRGWQRQCQFKASQLPAVPGKARKDRSGARRLAAVLASVVTMVTSC